MAWYNNGNWDGLYPREIANIMHELCTAVNDREKALGRGTKDDTWSVWYGYSNPSILQDLTTFRYNAENVFKRYPTVADFNDAKIQDVGTTPFFPNITYLRQAIERLIRSGSYNNTIRQYQPNYDDGTNVWPLAVSNIYEQTWYQIPIAAVYMKSENVFFANIADLLSMGSFGNTWLPVTSMLDVNIYLQIKEALDRLKYIQWNVARIESTRVRYVKGEIPYPAYPNWVSSSNTWNAAIAQQTQTVSGIGSEGVSWEAASAHVERLSHGYLYSVGEVTSRYTINFNTHWVKGTVIGSPKMRFFYGYGTSIDYTSKGLKYDIDFSIESGAVTSEVTMYEDTDPYTNPNGTLYQSGYSVMLPWDPTANQQSTIDTQITTPENTGWPGVASSYTIGNPPRYYEGDESCSIFGWVGGNLLLNEDRTPYNGLTGTPTMFPENYTHVTTDVSALMTYA